MLKDRYGLYISKFGNTYSVYVANVLYSDLTKKTQWMSGWSLGFNFIKKKHALGLMKTISKYLVSQNFPVITRTTKPK